MEQTNWKPGDIAICVFNGHLPNTDVNSRNPPLREEAEYLVNKVHICECGDISLDVGLHSDNGTSCRCGAKTSPTSGIWWANAKRFVKKQTAVETEKKSEYASLEEALKAEDYLAAAKIRDNQL